MGNEQSNERRQRNYKICKITSVSEHSGWIRCYLDDHVPYSDGEYRRMDFETDTTLNFLEGTAGLFGLVPNAPRQANLYEGRYIAIDTDVTREHDSDYNFSRRAVFNVNVADSSDLPGEGGFQGNIEEIAAMREMRARANEWADFDKETQRAWQLQPPKK